MPRQGESCEGEVVALFGQARVVKSPDGPIEIKGGSVEEQAQVRAWQAIFYPDASTHECPPLITTARPIHFTQLLHCAG